MRHQSLSDEDQWIQTPNYAEEEIFDGDPEHAFDTATVRFAEAW